MDTSLGANSGVFNLMRQLLAILLEQRQWRRSSFIAEWLAERGDLAASVVRVEIMLMMEKNAEALEALVRLPVSVRKVSRVRQLEARIVYSFGYPELAKQVYLSSLDRKRGKK